MRAHLEFERELDRFREYLAECDYVATTQKAYLLAVRSLRVFLDWKGELSALREISAEDLREFSIQLLNTDRGSSATAYMVGIRRFFAFLEESGTIDASPAGNVFPPKAHPRPTRFLQGRELTALLRACFGDGFYDLRDMAIFRIFMATGARRSEVVDLRIMPNDSACGDLDLDDGVVRLRDGADRTRRCALDPRTVRSIRRYLRARATQEKSELPDLWLTKYGGLTNGGIHDLAMARAAKAGVGGFRLHRIRVTFAHRWLCAGGNPGDLMRVLGLRSRKMIDGYADGVAGSRSAQAARGHFVHHRF